MRCKEIRIYFSKREKQVLDVLDGYTSGNWEDLKRELKSLYMSSVERKIYQLQDIQHFIAKKRKVSKLVHFNTYHCQFRVIMRGLEARNALSEYNRDNYFWSGICPTSLRDILENELRTRDYWMDLTLPPPMDRVIEVAVKFLNRAMYQLRDVSPRLKWLESRKKRRDSLISESELLDDKESDSSVLSIEDKLSSEEDNVKIEERKKSGRKKSHAEKRGKDKKDKSGNESKDEEKPADQNAKSNIEDLTEHFKHLELQLGERKGQQSQPPKTQAAMYCIMCGKSGHGIHDCSKSKFFISQDICRMDVDNRVIMSDGMALPHAEGEGGAAKQIHDQLAGNKSSVLGPMSTSASNVEVVAAENVYYDNEPEELTILGSMEFEVLPADRSDKCTRAKPYDRPDVKKGAEKTPPEVLL